MAPSTWPVKSFASQPGSGQNPMEQAAEIRRGHAIDECSDVSAREAADCVKVKPGIVDQDWIGLCKE